MMMNQLTITFAVIALVAQTAQAGHLGFGRGGPGLGDQHGGFGGGEFDAGSHGFGDLRPLGGLDTERLQTRFETKFENLQTDYDTGLGEIEDFYSTDDYADVVESMENLVDRYDLFLSGVERSIERLGDFISIATDDLTFYDEMIAEYEARDDLSEERLERILDRLTGFQDHLSTKIDFLTEKQTTLSENVSTYELFSTDLSTYLSEIVTAGGGTIDDSTEETAAAILSTSPLRSIAPLAALADEESFCQMPESALEATATPEPTSQLLGLMALGLLALRRPTRERPGC
jgi:hypothetical protein